MKKGWSLSFGIVMSGILLVGICGCPSSQYDALPGNDSELIGKWEGTASGLGSCTVEFKDDGTFTFTASSPTPFTNYGPWSTDDSQSPKWINIKNQRGYVWLGIYEINGNSLKWHESNSRPTAFGVGTTTEYSFTKVAG